MIQLRGVFKRYRSGRRDVDALRGVALDVAPGESVVVAGKSGSGKTTLLNCLGGLERVDEGTVSCFGVDVHAASRRVLSRFQRRDVGFVFQSGNLFSYLTVFDNIVFPLALNRAPDRRKRVWELLDAIALRDAARALPHELSGGEVQRVSFARAIAHEPRMLLADEPTASLDSETGASLVRLMLDLGRERGCTLIVSTHDPDVMELADRTVHLRDGSIVGAAS